MAVEEAGAAARDEHGEVVDGGYGRAGLGVCLFYYAVYDVKVVSALLVPALGEARYDKVYSKVRTRSSFRRSRAMGNGRVNLPVPRIQSQSWSTIKTFGS